MARILTPKDFGLIAMIMIVIQVSQAIIEGGFSLALIQKKDTDKEDFSSVFYINLVLSIVLYGIVFLFSPFISRFFNQLILTKLIRTLSLVFIINAFSLVQEAKLTKEIRFKTLAIIHIPSVVIGGIVGIVMALMGYGVWSLIFMQLSTRLAYTIQIWWYSGWNPSLSFNRKKARGLFSFGGKLLISNIVTSIYNNIFVIIIGRFFPLKDVGYYQNATNVAITPASTLTSVLNGVFFPVFSQIQEDNVRLKSGYKRLMKIAFFLVCPIFVLAGLLAVPLFKVVFGIKWLPTVPYFRWLCIVGILYPLNVLKLSIVNIKGRSDVFLKVELIRRIIVSVVIGLALILLPSHIMILLMIQAGEYVFMFVLFGYYCGKFIQYSVWEQTKDLLPIFFLNILMGVAIYSLVYFLAFLPDMILCIVGFITGGIIYWALSRLFKVTSYMDLQTICFNYIKAKLPKLKFI